MMMRFFRRDDRGVAEQAAARQLSAAKMRYEATAGRDSACYACCCHSAMMALFFCFDARLKTMLLW